MVFVTISIIPMQNCMFLMLCDVMCGVFPIDSVMKMEKNYPQVYLEKCKYRIKKAKITKLIEAD